MERMYWLREQPLVSGLLPASCLQKRDIASGRLPVQGNIQARVRPKNR
jgi:hypothetical protein